MTPLTAYIAGVVMGGMLGAFVMAVLAGGGEPGESGSDEEVIAFIEEVPKRDVLADWP